MPWLSARERRAMASEVEEAQGDEVVGGAEAEVIRVISRSFVFTLSVSPLDRPWVTAAMMPARCS